jgi:hypothetical protein
MVIQALPADRNPEARRASRSYFIVSKLCSLIINIIWKGKEKRVNNGYHCYHRTIRFSWFFWLKNRPEPNKTGSRFGPGCINKEYHFPVWLYFWVKTGPNRTVNTPSSGYFVRCFCLKILYNNIIFFLKNYF